MNEPMPLADDQLPPATSWAEIARRLTWYLATEDFARGDLAALRRMDPDNPDATAYWRLMARFDLLGSPDLERKWALILHGIALMTRTSGADPRSRSAHADATPVGRALFQGGDPERTIPFYSESRLNRLLTARGPRLRTLLARAFRMLGSAGQPLDWGEMARFILDDGHNESAADNIRRLIASAYYSAEHQAQRRQSLESSS